MKIAFTELSSLPDRAVLAELDGGVGGSFLNTNRIITKIVVDMIAWVTRLMKTWCLNYVLLSLLFTNKMGSTKARAAPRTCEAIAKVIARTLSFAPNHTLANLAALQMTNGCPTAVKT